jgi:hypothetical protein
MQSSNIASFYKAVSLTKISYLKGSSWITINDREKILEQSIAQFFIVNFHKVGIEIRN